MIHSRVICSSISFRRQDLPTALETMQGLGFERLDLGALPGVCDHVPFELDDDAVRSVADTVLASGLRVHSVNGDIGDLNVQPGAGGPAARALHLERLLTLTATIGAEALVLPCGAIDRDPVLTLDDDLERVAGALDAASQRAEQAGVELWVEAPHFFRLCWDLDRAERLADLLVGTRVGLVMDFSHIVASGGDPAGYARRFGDRIRHVHVRDAVPGDINLSVGNGVVDFGAGIRVLAEVGYTGAFALELETRDITEDQRPAAAASAAEYISGLISV